jgi:hypothetical protein
MRLQVGPVTEAPASFGKRPWQADAACLVAQPDDLLQQYDVRTSADCEILDGSDLLLPPLTAA